MRRARDAPRVPPPPILFKHAAHVNGEGNLRALPSAVVVVEELAARRMALEEAIGGVGVIDGAAEGFHDCRDVAEAGREVCAAPQDRLAGRDGLVETAGHLTDNERKRRPPLLHRVVAGAGVKAALEIDKGVDHAGQFFDGADAVLYTAVPARTRRALQPRHPDLPVEAAWVADGHRVVRRLEDDRGVGRVAASHEVEGAVAGVFLIDDALHDDVPPELGAGAPEVGESHNGGHQSALHVRRAAPVHQAVLDLGAEGIPRPFVGWLDGHGIDMAVEDQGAAAAGVSEYRDHVRPARIVEDPLQALRLKRLEVRQIGIGEHQIMLPVRRILCDVWEALEKGFGVRLQRLGGGAEPVQNLCNVSLRLALLAGEAGDAHQACQMRNTLRMVFSRQAPGQVFRCRHLPHARSDWLSVPSRRIGGRTEIPPSNL